MKDLVEINRHIIVQRDDATKIHKLTDKCLNVKFGHDTIKLDAVLSQPFNVVYKMNRVGSSRIYNLDLAKKSDLVWEKIRGTTECGSDNRDINDDGASQKLSASDILELRTSGASVNKIVETLIDNSKTFASKTEYSQEKYLKKKEKKYHECISIKKPTFRLIAECILRKNKLLGLRMDTLAQLTTLASVKSGGSYIVYESGCQGLVTAAVLNAMGSDGTIIHVHNGNCPEKQALFFMDLEEQRLNQILSVSVYSLPRKVDVGTTTSSNNLEEPKDDDGVDCGQPPRKKARWEEREEKAVEFLRSKRVDGLLVVGKEHPANIVSRLLKYVHPGRPFVTFSGTREPLMDLFLQLKSGSDVTALRLTESFFRSLQVLPDRTHPDINMTGSGGCLLSGFTVSS